MITNETTPVPDEIKRTKAELKLLQEVFGDTHGKALLNLWIKEFIIDAHDPPANANMLFHYEGQRYFIKKLISTLNINPETIMNASDEEYDPLAL